MLRNESSTHPLHGTRDPDRTTGLIVMPFTRNPRPEFLFVIFGKEYLIFRRKIFFY